MPGSRSVAADDVYVQVINFLSPYRPVLLPYENHRCSPAAPPTGESTPSFPPANHAIVFDVGQ